MSLSAPAQQPLPALQVRSHLEVLFLEPRPLLVSKAYEQFTARQKLGEAGAQPVSLLLRLRQIVGGALQFTLSLTSAVGFLCLTGKYGRLLFAKSREDRRGIAKSRLLALEIAFAFGEMRFGFGLTRSGSRLLLIQTLPGED